MTAQLPDKLSSLLRLAVHDAQKCESEPERFRLSMATWHTPSGGLCIVCMAGAVMAQTLGMEDAMDIGPEDTDHEEKLFAIDSMRRGHLVDAAYDLGFRPYLESRPRCGLRYLEEMVWARWSADRADWNTYLAVADALEVLGL